MAGLVLAAGAGRRFGGPKALARDSADQPTWVERSVCRLAAAGVTHVVVVTGAEAAAVADVVSALSLPGNVTVTAVHASDWAEGMGASLRAGLVGMGEFDHAPDAVLVTLVDLPDVDEDVHRRVLADGVGEGTTALVRAAYEGMPGHPVLIGRDHWAGILHTARGDRGARDYFAEHPPRLVECGGLATGRDVDRPDGQTARP